MLKGRPVPFYPKPKHFGGVLARKVVKGMRKALGPKISLPVLDSHILIALSGGPDSLALAWLLSKYGRRVVGRGNVIWAHVRHGWRPKDEPLEVRGLKKLAKAVGVKLVVASIKNKPGKGDSLEDHARRERYKALEGLARMNKCAFILTAHQFEDVTETLVWRVFTGHREGLRQGILPRVGNVVRPFLEVRRSEILGFIAEEELEPFEDSSNQNTRFLRAKMRSALIPALRECFPAFDQGIRRAVLEKNSEL